MTAGTYFDEYGTECCDGCDSEIGYCACSCEECGDSIHECACEEDQ